MKQKAITLLYHDVLTGDDPDASGFSGPDAAEYKISVTEFRKHLESINRVASQNISITDDFSQFGAQPKVLLSFDDGGASFYDTIAPVLEEYGWRGYFFITTDKIGNPSFLTSDQIKELDHRGHIIGSHSCSHPPRISSCSRTDIKHEWCGSISVLSDLLGKPVSIASIPGGFYSREVVEVAAECGIKTMFTSEPVQTFDEVAGCRVIGRFSLKKGDPEALAAGFASDNSYLFFKQNAYWNIKKMAKKISGPIYPWIRMKYLSAKN